MPNYTVKRSISPDGKIDAVSVEMSFEAEAGDQQTVLDAIASTNAYAEYVQQQAPAPRTHAAPAAVAPVADGSTLTVSGHIRAVFDGEPSRTSGKRGPGAIIIGDVKVKSFDQSLVDKAREFKNNGVEVEATYIRNDKWRSNDLKSIKAV